jgi:hypothetical protein
MIVCVCVCVCWEGKQQHKSQALPAIVGVTARMSGWALRCLNSASQDRRAAS